MSAGFPEVRARRLRGTKALRAMVAETALRPAELVLPVFIKEGIADPQPITSMPGVLQHTRESLRKAAATRRASPRPPSPTSGRRSATTWWSWPTCASASTRITDTAA
jgi:hypothetical protein